MPLKSNLITGADSYKFSHFYQDPDYVTAKMSHVVARKSSLSDHVIFFGLQAWIKERLSTPLTIEDVDDARMFAQLHGVPFNDEGWDIILREHGGYLPIDIWAVPEGTFVPLGVAQAVAYNTDDRLPWLTAYIETEMLRSIWYPSTVATLSYICKQLIYDALKQTSDNPAEQIQFKLHDFGQRGVSSRESAGLGGMAHLLNFMGTDTTEGIIAANKYYNSGMCGYSIPAMEHSTVTVWGQEHEGDSFANMIEHSPGPVVACVSDSYNIYHACEHIWGEQLKQIVIDSGKVVVVRPDSGDPLVVVPAIMNILADKFGTTTNSKGYKVLNNVRVIQGDGINIQSIPKIIQSIVSIGFSMDNLAFGMGSGLLQQVNRDTFGYAMKCNAAAFDGSDLQSTLAMHGRGISTFGFDREWFPVVKNPVTDSSKKSWGGLIDVVVDSDGMLSNVEAFPSTSRGNKTSILRKVVEDGRIVMSSTETFDQIKTRITNQSS